MYPDLSYFFHDLLGSSRDNWTSIFKTYGLFLVMAILLAAWLLWKDLLRREAEGQFAPVRVAVLANARASWQDYLFNALFGFFVGFKLLYAILHFEELQADAAGLIFSKKGSWPGGLLGLLAAAGAYWLAERKKQAAGPPRQAWAERLPHHVVGDITIIAAVSGVIGAKIFDILERLPEFFKDPLGVFFSGSGLAIYGGLIGGFIGVALALRRRQIAILPFGDALAPGLMAAYGLGRLGCHFSGDGDWGIVAAKQPDTWFLPDWLWSYNYPHNILREGIPIDGCSDIYCMQLAQAVYPTSIYEAAMAFSLAAGLWWLRKPLQNIPGQLFALYLLLNGLERWLIEKIRVNQRYDFALGLTQAEIIALSISLTGLALWLWLRQKNKA